jgi:hypothetical protein
MKRTMLATLALAVLATALTASPATVTAQGQAPDRSLTGVWLVKITPRNCAMRAHYGRCV